MIEWRCKWEMRHGVVDFIYWGFEGCIYGLVKEKFLRAMGLGIRTGVDRIDRVYQLRIDGVR